MAISPPVIVYTYKHTKHIQMLGFICLYKIIRVIEEHQNEFGGKYGGLDEGEEGGFM